MTRFSDEMVFRCGRVEIRGRHDAPNSGFDCALYVDGEKASEQCTYLSKPDDPKAVLSAVRGAISHAIENDYSIALQGVPAVDKRLLERETDGRWKVERIR